VHARKIAGQKKDIDRTFPEVFLPVRHNLFESGLQSIGSKTGVSHYISKFFGRDLVTVFCTHCGRAHLDNDYFAVKPHRKHLCHHCGREFLHTERRVSNPVVGLREKFGDTHALRRLKRAPLDLDIRQADFAGGIQLWASNEAILWTVPDEELSGIHVHAFDNATEDPVIDETYNRVTVDGVLLDEEMLGHFMAQQALKFLSNKIVALDCPRCLRPHFDKGEEAIFPHKNHICEACGHAFDTPGKRKLVISNPFLQTIQKLSETRIQRR
jgi:transposase-like protein